MNFISPNSVKLQPILGNEISIISRREIVPLLAKARQALTFYNEAVGCSSAVLDRTDHNISAPGCKSHMRFCSFCTKHCLLPVPAAETRQGSDQRSAGSPPEKEQIAVAVATITTVVDLDEEIRRRAYELYEQRNGQNGNAEGDWYMAVCDVCPRYEADGYRCSLSDGYWQAAKTSSQ